MPMIRKTISVILAAGMVALAGCGADDDKSSGSARDQAPPGTSIDRAFVSEALPVLEKSVALAGIAQKQGESNFVKQLAADIFRAQTQQIGTMRRIGTGLSSENVEVGSLGVQAPAAQTVEPATLSLAKPFDPAFLRAMIPLHESTIAMAKVELQKGKEKVLLQIARQMVDAEQSELAAMRNRLKP